MQECYSAPGISDHEIVLVTLEPEAFYNLSKSYKVYLWDSANLSELRENMLENSVINFVMKQVWKFYGCV